MSTINFNRKEINFKLVYYGPGLSGKTTNLQQIYDHVNPSTRGTMVKLDTANERTLFFDFLPIDLGSINGFQARFHLYTVPGQSQYTASRRSILRGVDGIIFVADSHPTRLRANAESMRDLRDNLQSLDINPDNLPLVIQVNKRDLDNALPSDMVCYVIDPDSARPHFDAVTQAFEGVFEPLRETAKLVLERIAEQAVG